MSLGSCRVRFDPYFFAVMAAREVGVTSEGVGDELGHDQGDSREITADVVSYDAAGDGTEMDALGGVAFG